MHDKRQLLLLLILIDTGYNFHWSCVMAP